MVLFGRTGNANEAPYCGLTSTVSTPSRVHCRTLTWQLHPSGTSNRQHTPPPLPPPPSTPRPYHAYPSPSLTCTFPHPPHPNPIFSSTNTLIPLPDNMKPAILKPTIQTSAWCPSRGIRIRNPLQTLYRILNGPVRNCACAPAMALRGLTRLPVERGLRLCRWWGRSPPIIRFALSRRSHNPVRLLSRNMAYSVIERGAPNTLEYRMYFCKYRFRSSRTRKGDETAPAIVLSTCLCIGYPAVCQWLRSLRAESRHLYTAAICS